VQNRCQRRGTQRAGDNGAPINVRGGSQRPANLTCGVHHDGPRLTQAEEGQNGQDHNDKTDKIYDSMHSRLRLPAKLPATTQQKFVTLVPEVVIRYQPVGAGRAGHTGGGFAVVAKEVKRLASDTAQTPPKIIDRIHAIQNAPGRQLAPHGIGDVLV
jgi:hypothetical protein